MHFHIEVVLVHYDKLRMLQEKAGEMFLGKDEVIKKTLACLLAGGHLLVEDFPGVGKTTLIKVLGKLLGLSANRVQCTNDILPSDIVGTLVFDSKHAKFDFHKGPIFSQICIMDELNRAMPRSQSACLQVMEEYEVTVDGHSYPVPRPFMMIATQNPSESIGTFPLPESQLDRFMMKVSIGYPDPHHERRILIGSHKRLQIDELSPIFQVEEIIEIQNIISKVHISEDVLNYIQDVVAYVRDKYRTFSTRGAIALTQASRSWAFFNQRDYIIPDDVKDVFIEVVSHRVGLQGFQKKDFEDNFLVQVHVP